MASTLGGQDHCLVYTSSLKEKVMKGPRDRSWVRWRTNILSCSGSYRIKLLLFLCLVFGATLLVSRASSIMGWRHSHQTPRSPGRHRYTVLINTWRRNDLLKQTVAHYAKCYGVDAIRVVWSEQNSPSDDLRSSLKDLVEVGSREKPKQVNLLFDIHVEDNLNNRFKPLEHLHTDAVFSIDDDVLVPCTTLEFAFSVWMSAPDSMVGFVPRMHWLDSTHVSEGAKTSALSIQALYKLSKLLSSSRKSFNRESAFEWGSHSTFPSKNLPVEHYKYTYGGWWSVWWMGTYSMVLSKAAFIHHKYLELYTYQMPASIRNYVRDERNCEDIAMSFLVANVTSAPPIWVKGRLFEIGSTGISSLQGHNEHRSRCVNHFATLFEYMPLVASHVKVVDARDQWFW